MILHVPACSAKPPAINMPTARVTRTAQRCTLMDHTSSGSWHLSSMNSSEEAQRLRSHLARKLWKAKVRKPTMAAPRQESIPLVNFAYRKSQAAQPEHCTKPHTRTNLQSAGLHHHQAGLQTRILLISTAFASEEWIYALSNDLAKKNMSARYALLCSSDVAQCLQCTGSIIASLSM